MNQGGMQAGEGELCLQADVPESNNVNVGKCKGTSTQDWLLAGEAAPADNPAPAPENNGEARKHEER